MVYMLYLFHNRIQKSVEEHPTHLSAYRSGENWEMLNKGNTFTILEWNEKRRGLKQEPKHRNMQKSAEDFLWEAHMDELLGGGF